MVTMMIHLQGFRRPFESNSLIPKTRNAVPEACSLEAIGPSHSFIESSSQTRQGA